MKKTDCLKNNSGFTLLEMLIVIAILGLMAGMFAFKLKNTNAGRFEAFANQVKNDLVFIKRTAYNSNITTALVFNNTSQKYTIRDITNSKDLESRNFKYGPGWTVTTDNYGAEIRFSSRGIPMTSSNTAMGGTITVTGPESGMSRTFTIFRTTGMIR